MPNSSFNDEKNKTICRQSISRDALALPQPGRRSRPRAACRSGRSSLGNSSPSHRDFAHRPAKPRRKNSKSLQRQNPSPVEMKFIDPHIHCVSRTTDDYQYMARCGVVAVSEPAFWAGYDRSTAYSFADYFRHLMEVEP